MTPAAAATPEGETRTARLFRGWSAATVALVAAALCGWALLGRGARSHRGLSGEGGSGGSGRAAAREGQVTALFFYCGCSPCRQVARSLSSLRGSGLPRLVGVTEMTPADRQVVASHLGPGIATVEDRGGPLKRSYGVRACPAIRVVSRDGQVLGRWDPGGSGLTLDRRQLLSLLRGSPG